MKIPILATLVACLVVFSDGAAQQSPGPEFTAIKEQYDARVKQEVQMPYDAAVVDLNVKYTAALDRALQTTQQAGKLEDAVAIKAEREAVAVGKGVPTEDEAETTATLKQLREAYRAALQRIEAERANRLQPLQAALTQGLDTLVLNLTKAGNLEQAMEVKKQREDLGGPSPPIAARSVGQPPGSGAVGVVVSGPKDGSFMNSLGMKFVPVPGTKILMCVHETRRQDYAAYAAAVSGVDESWKSQQRDGIPCGDKDNDPVVAVNWEDAQAFCAWLSTKEGKKYRLPTDEEWSMAAGIGRQERRTKGTTPEMLNLKVADVYPWGGTFPPKGADQAGNYADSAWHDKMGGQPWIEGYTDGFVTTAPVMSFKPNELGIYDLGGNVIEWVDDWFNATQKQRAARGASYRDAGDRNLLSSRRYYPSPTDRFQYFGFRCVMAQP